MPPPNYHFLQVTDIICYFAVRTTTQEEYEDERILKIELMVVAPPWDLLSPELSRQEQSMFNYRGSFVSPKTPAVGHLFINSATSYAYDAVDVIDNDNYATVLEKFVTILSLQVAKVNIKKVSGLGHLVQSI